MTDLPGFSEAMRLGYALLAYNGNRSSATYVKGDIFLTVFANGVARLEKIFGLVRVTVDDFSFPHKRFDLFENELQRIVQTG